MTRQMIRLGLITGDLKPNTTGIGTYTYQLIENIRDHTDITLIRHPLGGDALGCSSVVSSFPHSNFSHIIWSQVLSLKKIKYLKSFDIIHNPAQYPVSPKINPNYVITIHDLIPILYPEYVGLTFSTQAKLFYPLSIKYASKIITVSQHTKTDIMRLYKVPDEKIKVIYSGIAEHFKPASIDEIQRIKNKYNLINPFILFVGAIEPKKNLELLFKAFQVCQKKMAELDLVIAGKRAWKYESILKLVETLNIKGKTRFLDFVPYEDLPPLYSAAKVFVFPSRYEGFGFPPLEAMKCGTPVITSNASSLPEIVGEEGLMVSPEDHIQLAESILKISSDPEFHSRFSAYSLKRAELFTWKNTGRETLEVYNSVIDAGH